jgi:hypothetical protein
VREPRNVTIKKGVLQWSALRWWWLEEQPDRAGCQPCSGCETPPQGRRLSIALPSVSSRTHHKAKKACWVCSIFWRKRIIGTQFQFEQLEPSLAKIEQLFRAIWICALHGHIARAPHNYRLVRRGVADVTFLLQAHKMTETQEQEGVKKWQRNPESTLTARNSMDRSSSKLRSEQWRPTASS